MAAPINCALATMVNAVSNIPEQHFSVAVIQVNVTGSNYNYSAIVHRM